MDSEKTITTVAKGATLIIIGALLGKLLSFLYRVVVSRLGEQAYGELSIAIALFGILNVIALLGLETGLMKFISTYLVTDDTKKIKGSIYFSTGLVFVISVLLAILAFIQSQWIAIAIFKTSELAPLIKIFAITLPFESLRALIIAIFNAHQVVKYDVYWRVLFENALRIVAAIILIQMGYGIIGAAFAYLISIIISYVFFTAILVKKLPYLTSSVHPAVYENQKLMIYSLPLVFNVLALFLLGWVDSLLIGYLRTPAEVGIYNVAVPASRLLLIIPTALTTIYIPAVITVKNSAEDFRNLYMRTTKWILFTTLLIALWMIAYASEIVTLFFTTAYLAAVPSLIILVIGFFFYGLSFTSRDILLSYDKSLTVSLAVIIGAVINTILCYLLIPPYGINGAAIASALIYIGISIVYYFATYRSTKLHAFDRNTFVIILIVMVSTLLTWIATTFLETLFSLHFMIILGLSVVFLGALVILGIIFTHQFDEEDKEVLNIIITKIKKYIPRYQ